MSMHTSSYIFGHPLGSITSTLTCYREAVRLHIHSVLRLRTVGTERLNDAIVEYRSSIARMLPECQVDGRHVS